MTTPRMFQLLTDTEFDIQSMDIEAILAVLTDGMLWENEGPGWSCTEATAIAAAAVLLGADLALMAERVVRGHGQPGRSEEEDDDHYHTEEDEA